MTRPSKSYMQLLAILITAAPLSGLLEADAYYWHDTCVSDSWYACCEIAGSFHNNWWLTPYVVCPPLSQYPEDGDDVDILTYSVYLDSGARIYNFNSDGGFRLIPGFTQLEVHDLARLAGTFQWDGGTLAGWGPSTKFQLETVATVDTSTIKNLNLATFEIVAGATMNVVGEGPVVVASAQLHTLPSETDPGELNIAADMTIGQNPFTGGGSMVNEGLVRKSGGAGTSLIDVALASSGRVEVEIGTLALSGSGIGTGVFDVDASATLELKSYKLGMGATFPGPGLVRVPAGGTLEIGSGANVAIPVLELRGSTSGEGHLHVTEALAWHGGSMMSTGSGSPAVTVDAGCTASIEGPDAKAAVFGTIYNTGTIEFSGSGPLYFGVTEFRTLSGGTFEIRTDADIEGICCAGSGEFINAGTWVKTAGAGETVVNKHLTNSGLIEVKAGKLTFQSADLHQSGGRTRLNGGDLRILYTFYLNGGTLDGSGNVYAYFVRNLGGVVSPGLSSGKLSIEPPGILSGNYEQGAGGVLRIEIGGLTPTAEHDWLAIEGTASLGGTLDLRIINGFEPAVGDEFVIVTFGGRVGTFSDVTGATINAWKSFDVAYHPNEVRVRVVRTCAFEPCDADCNGTVNPFDIQSFVDLIGGVGAPCSPCAGDANGNGTVNPFDINDFLDCLT